MGSLRLLMVLAATSFTPCCMGPPSDLRNLGKAITHFSTDLTKVLSLRAGNVVFSPVSIHITLTMAWLGAKFQTAKEIRRLLEASSMPDLIESYESFMQTPNVNCDILSSCQMIIQNYFYWNPAIKHFHRQFLTTLNSTFSPNNGQFQFMSGWTQASVFVDTGGLDTGLTLGATLASAISVTLSWRTRFVAQRDPNMLFVTESYRKVKARGLRAKGQFKYSYSLELNSHVVRVPLENDRFGFYVIVPLDYGGLIHTENTLARRGVSLHGLLESVEDSTVYLEIPLFSLANNINLEEPLHEMGLHAATSSQADFTSATPQKIKLSQIRHNTMVSLNEFYLKIGSLDTNPALQVSPKDKTHGSAEDPGLQVSPKDKTHGSAENPGDPREMRNRRDVSVGGDDTPNLNSSLTRTDPRVSGTPFICADRPFLYYLRDDHHGILLLNGRLVEPQVEVVREF